ncbi:cytochrome P450 2J4-like [Antedon mediterranea]|uniref:cytochrome P450 2J4-like n=1 Tax=Antedon mediterranea TaxID=105859 RepID=UPI003AF8BD0D
METIVLVGSWFSPGLLVILIAACVCLLCMNASKGSTTTHIPGPKRWPIFGNALSIDRNAHVTFTKWAKTYGSVIGVKLGPMNVVVLNDLQSIESAFTKSGGILNRPAPGLLKAAFSNDGSLLWENGEKWKETRKFVLRFLHDFKQQKLIKLLNFESGKLCDLIRQHNGAAIDVCQPINMAVSNVLCALCFGHRFEYDDDNFRSLLSNLQALGKSVSGTTIGHFLPFLYYTPLYSNFRNLATSFTDFIDGEISQHIESYDPINVRDLIDAFLTDEVELDRVPNKRTETRVRRAIIDMFASGTDTTSTALEWSILYMTQYTEQQKAVSEIFQTFVILITIKREVDDVTRQHQLLTLQSYYEKLPYTQATIMEVLRHANVSPLGLPRKVSKPMSIQGHLFPHDSWVFANLWAVHHDEQYWNDPTNFRPERFLSVEKKTVISSKAFMPFGLGRNLHNTNCELTDLCKRCCVGEKIAMSTIIVILSKIMQEFNFKIPEEDPKPSLVGINGLTLSPAPFRVCAVPR